MWYLQDRCLIYTWWFSGAVILTKAHLLKKCKSLGLEQIQIVFVACWKIVKLRAYSRLKTSQFVFTCSKLTIETTEQDVKKIFKINNKDTRTTLDHPCRSTSSNLNMWLPAGLMHFRWPTISIKQSIIYRTSI